MATFISSSMNSRLTLFQLFCILSFCRRSYLREISSSTSYIFFKFNICLLTLLIVGFPMGYFFSIWLNLLVFSVVYDFFFYILILTQLEYTPSIRYYVQIQFYFFHPASQFSQHHLLNNLSFPHQFET